MRAFLILCTCYFLLFAAGATVPHESLSAFAKGNEAYGQADYQVALENFKVAEEDGEGFALNFNLGNTYYKLNQIPESILYFERALKFEPSNEDARYNLRFANERIADRIEGLPKTKFALWWEDFRFGIGPDGWAWISIGLSVFAALFLLLFAFGKSPSLRRFGFFAGLLSLLLVIAAYTLSESASEFRYGRNSAIVFADKVDVKSEPRAGSTDVFVLHAGARVNLLRIEGEWHHIEIASGGKGWVKTEVLEQI